MTAHRISVPWLLFAPLVGCVASCGSSSGDGDANSNANDAAAMTGGNASIGGGPTIGGGPSTGVGGAAATGGTHNDGGPTTGGGAETGGSATTGGAGGAPLSGGAGSTELATGGTWVGSGGAGDPTPGAGGSAGVAGGGGAALGTGGTPAPASGGSDGAPLGGSFGTGSGAGLGGADSAAGMGGQSDEDPDEETPTLLGSVSFSVPSQTFQGQLTVAMSAANASAEIRYTSNGSLPTPGDTLYAGAPLEIASTTQLRAQAFVNGLAAGAPSTALYILRDFDYASDIPIVVMEGYGGGKPPDKEEWLDLAFMTFEPVDGLAELANLPTLATRAGYHLRGQSSQSFPKAPYRVELWNNDGDDEDYPVLEMPAESDWAMIGPCSDSSLIRNAFLYDLAADMGLSTMRLRFAEVFINQDDSPLEEADYEGVYAVTETVKNHKDRLDLKQLETEDTTLPDITGGYIFKFDQAAIDEGETELVCTLADGTPATSGTGGGTGFGMGGTMIDGCWDDLELVDPDPANDEQIAWITTHIQTFHELMHTDPLGDYKSMLNVASFVDFFVINEISRNVDAYIRSHYMHKDRDGLITAGPVWDYNFALGNIGNDLEGWQWEDGRAGSTDWHEVMALDPEIWSAFASRWQELRPGILSDAQIIARIDAISAPLVNAGPRDNARWPVGECYSWNFGGEAPFTGDGTWEGEVQVLKDWTLARLQWIDSQLL